MPPFSCVGMRLIGEPEGASAPPVCSRAQPGQPGPGEASHSGTMPGRSGATLPATLPAPRGAEAASERPWERGRRGRRAWHSSASPSCHGGPKGVAADGSNLKQPRGARRWQPPACGSISYSLLWTPSTPGFGAKLGPATHKVGRLTEVRGRLVAKQRRGGREVASL